MARQSLVDILVPDEAYDPTGWDGDLSVPTKNAIRDAIEALNVPAGSDTQVQFNDSGVLAADAGFAFDPALQRLQLFDTSYLPLNSSTYVSHFTLGIDDYTDDPAEYDIGTSNNFVASAIDFKFSASGTPSSFIGQYTRLRAMGDYTGSPNIYGLFTSVSIRGNTTATPSVIGHYISLNNEGHAPVTTGLQISNYRGAINNSEKFIGVQSIVGNAYADGTELTGFWADLRHLNNNTYTTDEVRGFYCSLTANQAATTITRLVGLDIDDWATTATVTTSYGIYLGSSIDVGATKYAIYSLSTSPSSFAGDISVPDEAYDATAWNGSLEVPTKNAIRDKIESMSGGTPGGSDTQVQFNDGGVFGGDAGLTYNKTTDTLSVAGMPIGKGSATDGVRIGVSASVSGNYGIAIGTEAAATAALTISIGDVTTSASGAIGIGNSNANVSGQNAILIAGNGGSSTKISSIAIGTGADATMDFGIAIGVDSVCVTSGSDDNSMAIGPDATINNATESVALGAFATVDSFDNSVALGANSAATASNQIALGFGVTQVKVRNATVNSILDFSGVATSNKTFTFPNTTGTLALTSDIAIGASLGSATQGSVLFAGSSGVFAQDNANFFWDDTGNKLMLATNTPTVAHTVLTTPFQIGAATYGASVGSAGNRLFHVNSYLDGSTNNQNSICGYFDAKYNGTGTNPNITGVQVTAGTGSSSSTALQIIGGDFTGVCTSANGSTTTAGVFALGGAGASGGTTATAHGVRATIQAGNSSTVTTGNAVNARLSMGSTGTITNLRGLYLGDWSASGTITNSYGIYADTSIDRGATLKYFIYSLSTSPSLFTGTVEVPDDAYDATSWNGNNTVPTKNAIRDKIESLSAGSGITRTVVVTSGSATMGSSAATDYVYFVAGAHTMSLPAAAANTNRYTVKNNHSANITIDTAGAENVEGVASISIAPEESVDFMSDGTNWFVI